MAYGLQLGMVQQMLLEGHGAVGGAEAVTLSSRSRAAAAGAAGVGAREPAVGHRECLGKALSAGMGVCEIWGPAGPAVGPPEPAPPGVVLG